jgi:hypothetical protein
VGIIHGWCNTNEPNQRHTRLKVLLGLDASIAGRMPLFASSSTMSARANPQVEPEDDVSYHRPIV